MNINIRNIALLLLLGFGTMSSACAHEDDFFDFFGLSLNFGSPAYYGRPPVYYDARPVYVEPPRVIYDERPVVRYGYYDAQPYYYDDEHEHRHGHAYGHYKHHHHEDEDEDEDD